MHLRHLALALTLFSSLVAGHAAQTASFTVHLTDPRYGISATGELTLSNKTLSLNVPLPKIGAWMGLGMGPASSILWHNPFILGDCTTNGVCLLLNSFQVTDKQITEVVNGLWDLILIATADTGGGRIDRIDMRGRILPVDTDNDGVSDYLDACPDTPAGSVINDHGCSIEQLCPCDVAGKPFVFVVNVSQPTMTVYRPNGSNTGVAVVVFPGGGYNALAIDLEGTEICDWLRSRGITAVLLKYRVPTPKVGRYKESLQALQDAQRTLSLVRSNASKWHVDSRKIGVIGFSAGGHLVAALSTRFDQRSYSPVDAADQVSCRPDFAIALYPGHLSPWYPDDPKAWTNTERLGFNPNITVTSNTPPTFLLHAQNDPVDDVRNSMAYSLALRNARVPVELHLYAEGGQAFGLRPTKFPITRWPRLVEAWLRTIEMLSE
jgi:acetyl esterase/lipase